MQEKRADMLNIEGFNRRQMLPLLIVLIIGMILGWLGFILFGDFASNTNVVYVSSKEVLKLEKDRIEETTKGEGRYREEGKEPSYRLFYGYPDQALKLIEKVIGMLASKKTKVVFVGDSAIKGESVSSVSKQVHAKVLKLIESKVNSSNLEDLR